MPLDLVQAARLYRQAADQGFGLAQLNLGLFYHDGEGGLPKDPVQAFVWVSLAAKGGEEDAPHWRDVIGKTLTAEQLAQAQAVISAWKPAKPPV